MQVAMPYFVFMQAMVSCLIHSGNLSHISRFQFCRLVVQGDSGPCGATLMLNQSDDAIVLCINSLCFAIYHMDVIDVILSRMTPVNQCHFVNLFN